MLPPFLKRLGDRLRWLNLPEWLVGARNGLVILVILVVALAVIA